MSVPDREADENVVFTGEMHSCRNNAGYGRILCWLCML
jgi:hypothetical protein